MDYIYIYSPPQNYEGYSLPLLYLIFHRHTIGKITGKNGHILDNKITLANTYN